MTQWECHTSQVEQEAAGIRNMLDPDRPSVVNNNCEYMKLLLQYHQYFCSEEMAYKGHVETSESQNAGKWKEFINLMLRTNPSFKKLHDKIKQWYRTYDYTLKRSCKELIKAMASEVRRHIKELIDQASMYSMLIDECKDNARHEELAICFRFVNDLDEIEECFYELARLKETDAATIVKVGILPAFERMKTSASLIAVGPDGACRFEGVNKIVR